MLEAEWEAELISVCGPERGNLMDPRTRPITHPTPPELGIAFQRFQV